MRNGRLVDAASGVNVNGIDHLIRGFCILVALVLVLVLPGWCQEKATIRCESKATEKGRQCLVSIEAGIFHA